MRTDYHTDFLPEPGVMFLLDWPEISFGDNFDRDTFKLWDGYFEPIAAAPFQGGDQPIEFELWNRTEGWSWEDSSHLIDKPDFTIQRLSALEEADFECDYRADVDSCRRDLMEFLRIALDADRQVYIRRE